MAVWDWSTTAASNATADAAINWQEGQPPSSVNDSARAMMAAVKAFVRDGGGFATLGGVGNAFTLTLSQPMASRQAGLIGFFATRTNTGAVTLQVDSTAAAPLRAITAVNLTSGQIVNGAFYIVSWNSATSEYIITGRLTLALSDLPQIATGNVLANFSGSTGSPAATTMATLVSNVPPNAITRAMVEKSATGTLLGNNTGAAALSSATVTISIAAPGVVSWTAHGMAAGAPFKVSTTGALPTGISQDVVYYVISAGLTVNSFQFSTTPGGSAVNTSGSQSGVHTGFSLATADVSQVTLEAVRSSSLVEPVSASTGTTYTFVSQDVYTFKTFNNAAATAVTLPQAIGSFGAGRWIDVQNIGIGLVTITPTVSTIDGAATLIVPQGHGMRLISDGTNWKIIGRAPTASRVLLATLTASASASLSDTTSLTSLFRTYEIVYQNLIPATDAQPLKLEVHSGGSFQTTSYLANYFAVTGAGTGAVNVTTYIPIASGTLNTGSGASGRIAIVNPSQTTARKHWVGNFVEESTVSPPVTAMCGGYWNGGNGAITGFRILFVAGNITSGTVTVYGSN